jgi:heptosyltransferase-1
MKDRVLIVRLSAIGDVVMALPAAASIKASNPSAHIAWVVDSKIRELLIGHRAIDKVYPIFIDRKTRRNPARWRVLLKQHRQLKDFGAEIGIDLHGHAKSAIALRFSKAQQRYTLDPKDPISRLLGGKLVFSRPNQHRVEAYLDAVQEAGFPYRRYDFDLPINAAVQSHVRTALGDGSWVTIHPGGTHPRKMWPIERFVEVARWLSAAGERIVLVGGRGEEPLADKLVQSVPCEDWIGKTGLLELAEVLRRSKLHVSGDTGTAHIAAAAGTRCVTVFGHMPAAVYHPFGQPDAVVQCGDSAWDVPVDAVIEKIRERLG